MTVEEWVDALAAAPATDKLLALRLLRDEDWVSYDLPEVSARPVDLSLSHWPRHPWPADAPWQLVSDIWMGHYPPGRENHPEYIPAVMPHQVWERMEAMATAGAGKAFPTEREAWKAMLKAMGRTI